MIRLVKGQLARVLYEPLYQRLLTFANTYTRELMGEPAVDLWLQRLFAGDNRLHILVELDQATFKIVEHAVIDVQEIAPGQVVVVCHQVQHDKPRLDNIGVGHEYMMKLAAEVGASAIVFFVEKHSKAMERRFGYKTGRTVMIKSLVGNGEDNSVEA
jgi:hypothetical protein